MKPKVLVIIPARGGSKGIPRKNVRPLNGKPLIWYSIQTALQSAYNPDVFVSTEDEEIAFFAKKFGASVILRPSELSDDRTTLDSVIIDAYQHLSRNGSTYDLVVTVQPTSPLLKATTLDEAIAQFLENKNDIDTMISGVDDTHLTWRLESDAFFPNYEERVNRQYLPATYRETGGFVISKPENFEEETRISGNIRLFIVPRLDSVDIDTYEDWSIAESFLKRKNVLFRVSGYKEIGLGHVYNCLVLANEITNHNIAFIVDKQSKLAYERIQSNNYEVHLQSSDSIVDDIVSLSPDLVINDCLDTDEEYILSLKRQGLLVVNFEDLGGGSRHADVVFNAIYPEKFEFAHHYYGPKYFCGRDEFLYHEEKNIRDQVQNILITFGGVDPNNFTEKVLESIYDYCLGEGISITVITGMGYEQVSTLEKFGKINLIRNTPKISDYIYDADVVFSSAGRTIYELALMETPSIVLAQNERELTHFFASDENGFLNLGLGTLVSNDEILDQFKGLQGSQVERLKMSKKMAVNGIKNGKKRVIRLIAKLLED